MNGLDLAREYYFQVGRPMLEQKFPEYLPRIAAGLAGEGSECLGFDDSISRDHDFGPGFCLWMTEADYEAVGQEIEREYEALPGEFMGFGARSTSARGGGRVGAMSTRAFYRKFIGNEQPPEHMMRWLYLPEEKLAAVSAGEVFEDPLGEFSAIRTVLRNYYPEDVRIKKIAARAASMAQSGQYNYGRCMRRGDTVAAGLAEAEFIRNAMSMIYLLNRRYAPYYKWMYRGLLTLPLMREASELIGALSLTGEQRDAWTEPHPDGWNPYVNRSDRKVELMERICALTVQELTKQGLTERKDDFLEAHTWEIMDRIHDPELRRCHVLEG